MLLTDILLVFSLALFCFAWFARGRDWRQPVLWFSALLAFGAGLVGYLDWRWQAVPGPDIHASACDHTLEAAWFKVTKNLRQQIEGRKQRTQFRAKTHRQHPLTAGQRA